jgi:hypothetical protein
MRFLAVLGANPGLPSVEIRVARKLLPKNEQFAICSGA